MSLAMKLIPPYQYAKFRKTQFSNKKQKKKKQNSVDLGMTVSSKYLSNSNLPRSMCVVLKTNKS